MSKLKKNISKKYNITLALIIIIASFLRLFMLNNYPAINADEASNGYDAYSLLLTGKDQHGRTWPVSFQSFNDFKPGLYVYLDLPFVALMGLNEWAVRLPGAILGILSVLVLYYLIVELFNDKKFATVAALFLAISPWHVHFSRGGWEVNTSTFFILGSLLFFIKTLKAEGGTQKKLIFILISTIFLSASLYAYHASRVIVPLLLISACIVYGSEIRKNLRFFVFPALIFAVLISPLVIDLLNPQALSRAVGVGLTADKGPIARINEQRGEHDNLNSLLGKGLHNKFVNYGLVFLNNWTLHFNGEFLFMSGDSIERNKVPETGQLYLFDIILLAFGFVGLVRTKDKNWRLIVLWLLIAPIASALTFQSPNALRSQNMVIPLVTISAYGLTYLSDVFKKNKYNYGMGVLIILMTWNFARYQEMYWKYMSKIYPYSSQYGVKELTEYIKGEYANYDKVLVTTRYDQPYVLFLFYSKYPPLKFQDNHTLTTRDEYGFSTVASFDKFIFGPIDFEMDREAYPGSLIAGTPNEIPTTANIIKRIYGTNSFEYFDVVSN